MSATFVKPDVNINRFKREKLTKDGLYAVVKSIEENEVLFRKFDKGLWIASSNKSGEVTDMMHMSNEQLNTIVQSPSIKVGDGETPQSTEVENVVITKKEYERLLECRHKLSCLESAGVDNWSGYSDAMAEFYGDDEE